MYELKFEDKHNQILGTIELKKLENIYQKSTKQEKVDKFILEDVFKKAGYGINILKPIPEKNDFKFIYTSPIFWDYFHPNLHQYNKGRYFKQVYNKIENIKINIPKFIQKDSRHDEIIKLYHNNKLIKIWTISKIIQNNLLYLFIEDKTATYFEKEKDDKIFKYSPFPKMNLNKEGEVIKLNKALTDFLGYTVQDLNNKNLDDYVTTFNSPNQHIKGFMDAVNQIFNKKIDYVDSKLGLISKKGDYKWVSCHIRLINDNLVQVSLQDLSELKQTQQETLNLTRYLSGIEEASKTAFYIKDNNHFQWTDEIFTILELDSSQQENNSHKNILKEYIPPETQKNVDKSFKRLTKTQPVTIEHEIITAKGNTKYIRAIIKLQQENKKLVEVGFIQDITNEKLAQKKALELTENIKEIQEFSKIFLATLKDGEYYYTPEVYNILELDPEKVSPNELTNYLIPEDREELLKLFKNVSVENPTFNLNYRILTSNGDLKYVSCYSKGVFDYKGELLKMVSFQQDVTEEVVAKEKLLTINNIMSLIQGLTKIFLGEYKNGQFNFTSELYNILGVTEENFKNNYSIKDFVLDEDKKLVEKFLKELTPEKTYNHLTFRVKNTNNEIRYIYTCSRAEFDEDEELNSIVGFFQDVTEETLLKQDAFELQDNISSIQSFSKIFLCTVIGDEFVYTPEVYNILDLSPKEYSDKDLINFIDPEYREDVLNQIYSINYDNPSCRFSYNLHTPNGVLKIFRAFVSGKFDENHELIKIIGFIQEVTDEILAHKEALELQSNMEHIQSFSKIFIGVIENGQYHYTGDVYGILEASPEEYNENDLEKLIIPEDMRMLQEYMDNLSVENSNYQLTYRLMTPKGNLKYLKSLTTAEFNEDGELVKIIGFVQDVTDETLRNQEALELQENIHDIQDFSKIFISINENGNVSYTDEVFNILEISDDNFDENELVNFIVPEDLKVFLSKMDGICLENPNFHLLYRLITPKGNLKYLKTFKIGKFNDDGELIKIVGFVQDVTEETLIHNETIRLRDNFEVIQDSSKVFIAELENGKYSWTNEINNIFGINKEEYSQEVNLITEFILPEDKHLFDESMILTINNPNKQTIVRIKRPDEDIRYLNINNRGKFDKDNNLIRTVGFIRDITEETLANKESMRLTENFALIESTSKSFICEFEDGKYSFTGEVYNILEVSPDEFPDDVNVIKDFIVPEDQHLWSDALKDLNPDNSEFSLTYRLRNRSGELIYINSQNKAVFDNDGDLVRLVGFIQDVTDEKLANIKANRLTENFALIESTSKSFICEFEDGKYSFTGEVYNILEVSSDEFPDDVNVVKDFIVPEDQHLWSDALKDLNPDNSEFSLTYRLRNRSGELIYINSQNKAVFDNNGDLVRLVGFIQDVTDEKLANIKANRLTENFALIESTSKSFICEFEDGKYSFTGEVYNILEVSSDEFPDDVNVVKDFIVPEDQHLWSDALKDLNPDNSEFSLTYRLRNRSGELIYINSQNKAVFDNDGDLVRLVGFIQDVTDEKLANIKANRLQENFALMEETGKIFIAELNEGKYHFSMSLYDFLGIKSENQDNNNPIIKKFVLPEDLPIYNHLMDISSDNPVLHGTFRVKTTKGEIKYLNTTNKAKFDNKGNLIRIVGLLQDVTEETLKNQEALELKENLDDTLGNNKMFIGTYENGKFSYTDSIYDIAEGKKGEFNPDDLLERIYPEDLKYIYQGYDNITIDNPSFKFTYRVTTLKNNLKYLRFFATGRFNDDGELIKIINIVQDVTEETLAQREALQLQKDLNVVQSSSKIVFVHSRKGKYVFTDEIYNILEIDANDFPEGFDVINYFTILSDKDKVYEKTNKLTLDNPNCRNIATVKTPNGNVKVLEGFMTGEFDSDGNLIGHIGLVQEITDRVKREKELEQLSEDRKILLQEVHHRVKNNLQIILSFLSLESRYNKDNPEYVIDQTKNRISTMALIHEEIYQSPSVSNINLEHFLTKSMKNLFNLYTNGRISLFFNIEPIEVDIDKGIPLGLLVNEVALNTIKYAFPGNGSGKFNISLHQVDGDLILKVWDNGIGLPKGVDLFNSSSLGFIIINNLTKQLEGELSVLEDAPGFGIQLVFKA